MPNEAFGRWISENVPEAYGKCAEVTIAMQATFPELRRVRGHYYCPVWGEREHWWLIDAEGEIVDPTAKQFPSGGLGEYVEWDESQPEPTGMCPNCGGHCYGGESVCSEKCGIEYVAYCSSF
jgi:hypothetical protein